MGAHRARSCTRCSWEIIEILRDNGRLWESVADRGRAWEIVGDHGISWEITCARCSGLPVFTARLGTRSSTQRSPTCAALLLCASPTAAHVAQSVATSPPASGSYACAQQPKRDEAERRSVRRGRCQRPGETERGQSAEVRAPRSRGRPWEPERRGSIESGRGHARARASRALASFGELRRASASCSPARRCPWRHCMR